MKIDVNQSLEARWEQEREYFAQPFKSEGPETKVEQDRRRRLTADCIGPRGERTIYHPSMGRMMGVRGG